MVPVLRPAVCCLRDETGRSRRPPMAWSGPGHSNACPAASLLIFTPNARWQSATGLPVCRAFPCTGLVGGSTIPCSTYAFVIHTTHAHAHARFTIADHTSPHPSIATFSHLSAPVPPPPSRLALIADRPTSNKERRTKKKNEERRRLARVHPDHTAASPPTANHLQPRIKFEPTPNQDHSLPQHSRATSRFGCPFLVGSQLSRSTSVAAHEPVVDKFA